MWGVRLVAEQLHASEAHDANMRFIARALGNCKRTHASPFAKRGRDSHPRTRGWLWFVAPIAARNSPLSLQPGMKSPSICSLLQGGINKKCDGPSVAVSGYNMPGVTTIIQQKSRQMVLKVELGQLIACKFNFDWYCAARRRTTWPSYPTSRCFCLKVATRTSFAFVSLSTLS